uniref:Peptidoglycan recognition protein family domain-containing protein n=1 Tax=Anopheles atroparvus TaxID=41427 RepID=A0A8W7NYT1_ANOAO
MDSPRTSTATPIPESVANALMSIHPRYNSFQQHNAIPATAPLGVGARYEQSADNPGMAAHQNHADVRPGGSGSAAMQGAIQPAATSIVNLTNSSDVVIGPMTQYQGSVTIYQYMDATVEASRIANGHNNQNNLLLPNTAKEMKYERYIVYSVILLFVLAGFLILFYYLFQTFATNNPRTVEEIFFGNNFVSKTIPNLGNGHMIIDRSNWGAQQNIRGPYDLTHPIPYVLITHIGVHAKNCTNVHMCSIKMRTLQDAAIAEKSLQDIPSNFYLGGDGNVYVGRGWDTANAYVNQSLAVCFMGDYGRYEPNELQFSALDHLLTYGETHDLLTKDYKVVAHRQAHSTRSPGIKLYEKITKLSRWSPCGLTGFDKCGKEIGLPEVWRQEYVADAPLLTTTTQATTTIANSE